MSDIVKRLRDADTTRRIGESYADTHERRQRDRDEAADEIEKLRRGINATAEAMAVQVRTIEQLRAEVKRLAGGGCARDQSTTQFCAEAARLASILTPKPLDDSAPKDRELIGVERPPCEDRNYFSFIQWHEDKQLWMSRIGYDWSVNPAPTLWAICGASHYLDPLDFPLLPEEAFEGGDDDDQD